MIVVHRSPNYDQVKKKHIPKNWANWLLYILNPNLSATLEGGSTTSLILSLRPSLRMLRFIGVTSAHGAQKKSAPNGKSTQNSNIYYLQPDGYTLRNGGLSWMMNQIFTWEKHGAFHHSSLKNFLCALRLDKNDWQTWPLKTLNGTAWITTTVHLHEPHHPPIARPARK